MTENAPTAEAQAEQAARPAGPDDHDESIVEILAAKVLIDWLRNRQQLLVPFKIDLQKLDAAQVSLLLHALIAAAQADGTADGKRRVEAALVALNAAGAHRALLDAAFARPAPLAQTLAGAKDVQTGALVYAASLLAVDRRKLVNRQYLKYLAARLQLPKDLTRSLEQRFYLAVE
ncbi:MAG: hypothetical protein JWO70_581 [Betaproteobacteria bacterium]|nr:hypothetical protein [Betaproteobacteria bacterium]